MCCGACAAFCCNMDWSILVWTLGRCVSISTSLELLSLLLLLWLWNAKAISLPAVLVSGMGQGMWWGRGRRSWKERVKVLLFPAQSDTAGMATRRLSRTLVVA